MTEELILQKKTLEVALGALNLIETAEKGIAQKQDMEYLKLVKRDAQRQYLDAMNEIVEAHLKIRVN